jgi:hypothetical protein
MGIYESDIQKLQNDNGGPAKKSKPQSSQKPPSGSKVKGSQKKRQVLIDITNTYRPRKHKYEQSMK